MGKSLWNYLLKGAAIVATGLALKACPFPCPSPTPPKSTLSINPSYGKNPLTTNIKYTATDSESDVENYEVSIDVGEDGTLDEVISQSSPINVTRTYNTGKVKISGRCTDSTGLIDAKDAQIVVSASDIPTVDLSGVNVDVAETRTRTVNLPSPIDSDTPGVIPYTSAEILTGDVTSILNGNQLTVQSNSPISQETNYQIKLTFGTDEGGMNEATLESKILNLCNVSGVFQDNETDTNKSGIIRIYNASNNNLLGETSTSGNFNIQANEPSSTIKLQGAIKEGGVWKSYVRTINLDGKQDYSDLTVRAVPFPSFSSNDDFKAHVGETNTYYLNGIQKWDLDKLQKVEVLKYNPVNSSITFTDERQEFMRGKITDPSDVRIFVEGRSLDVQVDTIENQESQKHYSLLGEIVIPDEGYIIVVPITGLAGGQAFVWDANYDGEIEKVKLNIGTGAVNDAVVSHEFGHGLISPDHAYTLSNALTIMVPSGVPTRPKVEDAKSAKIVYEDTYLPKEKRDDILGQSFNDGESVY